RSISAADADGPPVLASLVQQFNAVASAWNALRAKATFLDLPALTLPASPRLVVTRTVPGEYLSITAVTPAPIQATDTSGEPWMVTFTNQQQGDDHDFSYNVRFSFGGLPDQEQELGGTLRPSKYTVASLQLTPAIDTVLVGTSVSFEWAAADSSGDILTDSLLLGRKPTWTSGSPTVATVGASSGSVTGKQAGNAMIEA